MGLTYNDTEFDPSGHATDAAYAEAQDWAQGMPEGIPFPQSANDPRPSFRPLQPPPPQGIRAGQPQNSFVRLLRFLWNRL